MVYLETIRSFATIYLGNFLNLLFILNDYKFTMNCFDMGIFSFHFAFFLMNTLNLEVHVFNF
jgi:hypothetical protein